MVWIHIDEEDFFSSSTIMVNAQEACVLQTPKKTMKTKMIKQFSTIQLANVNKHLHFMKIIKEMKHNQYICLCHI
jgi:hypothetical protein